MNDAATFYGETERRGASDNLTPAVGRMEAAVGEVLTHLSPYGLSGAIEILHCALMFASASREVGMAVPENTFEVGVMDTNRN